MGQKSLIVVGDMFDFHPHTSNAAKEGLLFLAWCAAHDSSQIDLIFGNHDYARVSCYQNTTFEMFDTIASKVEVHEDLDSPQERRQFRIDLENRYPNYPPLYAVKDYKDFDPDQVKLVKKLLKNNRFLIASCEKLLDQTPALLSHTGFTKAWIRDHLKLESSDHTGIQKAMQDFLNERVKKVLPSWGTTHSEPLDLMPWGNRWTATEMFCGGLVHRPTCFPRKHHLDYGFDLPLSRETQPYDFADTVQIVGHTSHLWSKMYPNEWVTPTARKATLGPIRNLSWTKDKITYDIGNKVVPAEGQLFCVDSTMGKASFNQVELLELIPKG